MWVAAAQLLCRLADVCKKQRSRCQLREFVGPINAKAPLDSCKRKEHFRSARTGASYTLCVPASQAAIFQWETTQRTSAVQCRRKMKDLTRDTDCWRLESHELSCVFSTRDHQEHLLGMPHHRARWTQNDSTCPQTEGDIGMTREFWTCRPRSVLVFAARVSIVRENKTTQCAQRRPQSNSMHPRQRENVSIYP